MSCWPHCSRKAMKHCRGAENIFVFVCLFLGLMMAQKQSFSIEKNHFPGLEMFAPFEVWRPDEGKQFISTLLMCLF